MLKLLLMLFSANCDSLNSEIYNIDKRLNEVEFCQCVDKETFSGIPNPKKFRKYQDECEMIKLNEVEIRYNKSKKGIKK